MRQAGKRLSAKIITEIFCPFFHQKLSNFEIQLKMAFAVLVVRRLTNQILYNSSYQKIDRATFKVHLCYVIYSDP